MGSLNFNQHQSSPLKCVGWPGVRHHSQNGAVWPRQVSQIWRTRYLRLNVPNRALFAKPGVTICAGLAPIDTSDPESNRIIINSSFRNWIIEMRFRNNQCDSWVETVIDYFTQHYLNGNGRFSAWLFLNNQLICNLRHNLLHILKFMASLFGKCSFTLFLFEKQLYFLFTCNVGHVK